MATNGRFASVNVANKDDIECLSRILSYNCGFLC